ncbi:MAG: Uma2 family endonuclease [Oscillatoriales cyanobacterium SM2_2_1]|nr:Uma2 family endonuclease [Oscillatoriales cyanobacterium SM2_2_1]
MATQIKLTLTEFLALPEDDIACEWIEGEVVPKMSPKFFHSTLTMTLWSILHDWSTSIQYGRVGVEWAIRLLRSDRDWVPVPDILLVSFARLTSDWREDSPCPVPPELAIEIISPGQPFGKLVAKATDYLSAGVLRVWIVDSHGRTLTVFYPDAAPRTYNDEAMLQDDLFPGLAFSVTQLFQKAGLD